MLQLQILKIHAIHIFEILFMTTVRYPPGSASACWKHSLQQNVRRFSAACLLVAVEMA
jgi:hypothetical protein